MPHKNIPQGPASRSDFALLLALGLLMLLCGLMLNPFLPAFTGTLAIGMLSTPLVQKSHLRTSNRTAFALAATAMVGICILIPATFLASHVVSEVLNAVQSVNTVSFFDYLKQLMDHLRSYLALRGLPRFNYGPGELTRDSLQGLRSVLLSLASGSAAILVQGCMLLFLLFFWFRDSDELARIARHAPFSAAERRLITRHIRRTLRAIVVGTFVIAAIQGLIAWIIFRLLSVPAAALLANLTAFCAIIPAFGAYFVWLPVVGYLALLGHWGKALILLALGVLILSTIDNVLYPALVGSRAHMHTAVAFLSIFGGISLLGISGLVLGPVLWATTEVLSAIWIKRTRSPGVQRTPRCASTAVTPITKAPCDWR